MSKTPALPTTKIGRPSKYDPAMCERVIEWGRQGKSRTWIAASLDVQRETLNEWAKTHSDFSDAITRAKALEQQWWEDVGQANLITQGFQQAVWSRSMAARFPADWRDKSETKLDTTDALGSLLSKLTLSVFPKDSE